MIGFRILKRRREVSCDVVERFRAIPVANISDAMSRMTAAGAGLRPLHSGGEGLRIRPRYLGWADARAKAASGRQGNCSL